MRTGVPCAGPGQPLVAATPQTVSRLVRLGYEVCVQSGAGSAARFPDSAYEEAGAQVVDEAHAWACELVLGVDAPDDAHLALMREGAAYVGRLGPARSPGLVESMRDRGVTGLALDVVPRISRAQAMDVLSSQANLAGYRAVIEAAAQLGRMLTGQVTAAGKLPPASVYVIGAGVAGLAAIGTACSLGAQVRGTDVRPEVADQVRSMGADFVPVPTTQDQESQEASTDGYARQMTADQASLAEALYARQAADSDIVITTANVPGRRAPVLLDRAAVEGMRPGSVIVDMAAANGGNTELTVPGEVVVTDGGVTIVGYTDLAALLPSQASQLYAQNLVNLLMLMTPAKDGELVIDLKDQVVRTITVTHQGEVLWPPPPVTVSASPTPPSTPTGQTPSGSAGPAEGEPSSNQATHEHLRAARTRRLGLAAAAVALAALVLVTPAAAASHYVVLVLAVVLGFYVISNVTPALHTPLMSVTNAISGIILLGAISQVGSADPLVSAVSLVAIVLASVNVFGGFAVTHRMLAMFRKD